jgi:hypothetical protein
MGQVDIEVIKIIISNNFSMINLTWSSGLAWWLSSFVFALTLFGKLYPSKKVFIDNGLFVPVGMLVSFILVSLITFGIVVIHDLSIVEVATYKLFINICSNFNAPNSGYIFDLVRKLYVIVTSSLIVFLIAWLYLWFFESKPSSFITKP